MASLCTVAKNVLVNAKLHSINKEKMNIINPHCGYLKSPNSTFKNNCSSKRHARPSFTLHTSKMNLHFYIHIKPMTFVPLTVSRRFDLLTLIPFSFLSKTEPQSLVARPALFFSQYHNSTYCSLCISIQVRRELCVLTTAVEAGGRGAGGT